MKIETAEIQCSRVLTLQFVSNLDEARGDGDKIGFVLPREFVEKLPRTGSVRVTVEYHPLVWPDESLKTFNEGLARGAIAMDKPPKLDPKKAIAMERERALDELEESCGKPLDVEGLLS